jgi:hypothetical protein
MAVKRIRCCICIGRFSYKGSNIYGSNNDGRLVKGDRGEINFGLKEAEAVEIFCT